MIKIKKSTFTTDEHVGFVQERSASILKDHVALFTYTGSITNVALKQSKKER
jgi:hypothetical protein